MGQMNWNRPVFRIQGKKTSDVRKEMNRLMAQQKAENHERRAAKRVRRKQRQAERLESFGCRGEIADMIAQDVRDIANDKFFNTSESIQAEVRRRLAGIDHTRRIMAALAVQP